MASRCLSYQALSWLSDRTSYACWTNLNSAVACSTLPKFLSAIQVTLVSIVGSSWGDQGICTSITITSILVILLLITQLNLFADNFIKIDTKATLAMYVFYDNPPA